MKLVVFGASGKTGREVVRQALARGFAVTAFVRDPARLQMAHADLRAIQGDIGDPIFVAKVLAGHDAVVSTLGVGTPLTHDPVVIEGIRTIARAVEQASVDRLVYLSFIGVRASRESAGFILKRMARTLLRHEVSDHEAKEAVISTCLTDWTIVRPPRLTDGRLTAAYRAGEDIRARSPLPMMSRADVADFMLRQLTETAFIRKAVSILH